MSCVVINCEKNYINYVNQIFLNVINSVSFSEKISSIDKLVGYSRFNKKNPRNLIYLQQEECKLNSFDDIKIDKLFKSVLSYLFDLHKKGYIHYSLEINNIYIYNDNYYVGGLENVKQVLDEVKVNSKFYISIQANDYKKFYGNFKLDLYLLYAMIDSLIISNNLTYSIEEYKNDVYNMMYKDLIDKYDTKKYTFVHELKEETCLLYNNKYLINKMIHIKNDSVIFKTIDDNVIKLSPSSEILIINNIKTLLEKQLIDIQKSYYVMPLYEKIHINENTCYDIINNVLVFLKQFHKMGYIHNDIKCPNIMKFNNDYILIDFGLSCLYKNIPKDNIVYTKEYNKYIYKSLGIDTNIPIATPLTDIYMLIYTVSDGGRISDDQYETLSDYISNLVEVKDCYNIPDEFYEI